MGTKTGASEGIAAALFTPVQQRVLGILFGQPDKQFQSAELIRLAASGTGGVHRFVSRLEAAGLVVATRVGNQKHYRANENSPVFAELTGLIVKTVGLLEPLRRALDPVAARVRVAFVYGSVARGAERSSSDVDLMVVTDTVTYADIYECLQAAEAVLSRPINPTVMSVDEWRTKRALNGSFASRIAHEPKLYVIGSIDDLS